MFSIWRLRASLASTCAAPWTNFCSFWDCSRWFSLSLSLFLVVVSRYISFHPATRTNNGTKILHHFLEICFVFEWDVLDSIDSVSCAFKTPRALYRMLYFLIPTSNAPVPNQYHSYRSEDIVNNQRPWGHWSPPGVNGRPWGHWALGHLAPLRSFGAPVIMGSLGIPGVTGHPWGHWAPLGSLVALVVTVRPPGATG